MTSGSVRILSSSSERKCLSSVLPQAQRIVIRSVLKMYVCRYIFCDKPTRSLQCESVERVVREWGGSGEGFGLVLAAGYLLLKRSRADLASDVPAVSWL